jgi:release factor glutamine methyltransferase
MIKQKQMNVRDLLAEGTDQIRKAGIENARFEAELLLAHILKWDRVALYTQHEAEVDEQSVEAYQNLLTKSKEGMPYAYIVGKKEFMGLSFTVNEKVLIPRPDTESLVSDFIETFDDVLSNNSCTVLDLCTGSGAIGLSIAKLYPKTKVTLSDISNDALNVAEKNRQHLDLQNVQIVQSDLFQSLKGRRFDYILSNPPYIESGAIQHLQKEIAEFEPKKALDGGEDGLDYYRNILNDAPAHLNQGGYLLLELGDGQHKPLKTVIDHSQMSFVKDILDLTHTIRGVLLRRN